MRNESAAGILLTAFGTSVLMLLAAVAADSSSNLPNRETFNPSRASAKDGVALTLPDSDVVEPGKPLSLRLVAENRGPSAQIVVIRYTLQDDSEYTDLAAPDPLRGVPGLVVHEAVQGVRPANPQRGPALASNVVELTVPARGSGECWLRGSANLSPGAYLLSLDLIAGAQKQLLCSHLFVLPSDPVALEKARRFGINGSGAQAWLAGNLRRCGFGWVRFENAKWQMYMPGRDIAAFDGSVAPWHVNLDGIFTQYQQSGLRVLPYVFQPPEWATSAPAAVQKNRAGYPPKDPADYGDAIFQLVARYGHAHPDTALLRTKDKKTGLGLINAVELWNEPNLNDPNWGPFVGTMPEYFEVMRAGVEGARRADPTLPVSACGLAGLDLEIVGQLSEYRYADGKRPLDLVDIVNVHFYSGRQEPELAGWDPNVSRTGPSPDATTYPEQLEDLVAWRDQLKPKAELWLSEIGNDVGGPIGLSERHQAAKLPRGMLLALAAGVDRVFVYRETGSDPAMHAGAGLLRNDGGMRPAWLTVATLIRQLQGFNGRAVRLPTSDPKQWMLLWREGGQCLVTAWTLGESTRLGVDFGTAEVCDSFGRAVTVNSTAEVALGYFPTYIRLSAPTTMFRDLVASAKSQSEARVAKRQRLAALPMRLFDFGPTNHVGMLKGFGLPRRFTPVGKDQLWDERRGYGFAAPAMEDLDQHWVPGSLERDSVRLQKLNPFRFRLEPGRYVLRVRAEPVVANPPLEVLLKAGDTAQKRTVEKGATVVEFQVEGGAQPVEVSLSDIGFLKWLTAIPVEASSK